MAMSGHIADREHQKFQQDPSGYPSVRVTQSDTVAKRIVDTVNSQLQYIGVAPHGSATSAAVWQISRVLVQGAVTTTEYAAQGAFTQVWDNRASLFTAGGFFNQLSTDFDGVNDSVACGDNYTFEVSTAFSIGFWVKPNNLAASRCLISKASNDANVWGYNIMHLVTSGAIQLQMRTSGGSGPVHAFTTALTAGVWQHIVLTYAGGANITGARCYRNAAVGDTPASSALAGSFANTANFTIGARNTAFPFSGLIDEVTVWNKALSQAEVTALYNGGVPAALTAHPAYGNLLSWWRMGDGDTFPTITDQKGSAHGTMTNMVSGDLVGDVP